MQEQIINVLPQFLGKLGIVFVAVLLCHVPQPLGCVMPFPEDVSRD
jgi:hypothetical protein